MQLSRSTNRSSQPLPFQFPYGALAQSAAGSRVLKDPVPALYDLPLQQRIKVPLSGLDKGRLIADAVALKLCFVGIPILFIPRDIQIVHPVSPALHIRQHHKVPGDLQFQTHAARQGRQFVFLLQKQPDGVLRPLRAGYQSFGMTDESYSSR